ncbi:unnamed protein product [Ceutorhynchus assimilis]|uniref:Sodium channel protein Nach n=1 Tax=Ceutorhynchus assimilis TaxID=467358 RepID=A0A9N9N3U5_9CUCU|nr:unnamed protein product [Ceutorhynchus assimilis]
MQTLTVDSHGIPNHGFHIFVHHVNDIMTSEYEQDNNFLDYIYLEANEDIRLQLKYQEFHLVHTHENPCVELNCLEQCLHYQIANRTNCTLPWLWLLPSDWLPQCNTSEQLSMMTSFFLNHNRRLLVANCSCPKSCRVILYTPTIVRRKDLHQVDNDEPYSFIAMYYPNNLVTQMRENLAYNINAFVSDIGGSLGFLLGLSVIGLIQVLEKIVCKLIKTCYRKKKPEDEHSDVISNSTGNTDDTSRIYSATKPHNLYGNLRDFESDDFKYYQRTLVASENRF